MWRHVWIFMLVWEFAAAKKYNLTLGYLPCLTGHLRERQGLTISGALSLALEEINNSTELLPDVHLSMIWRDTQCDTAITTRLIKELREDGVVAFFGPEAHCEAEVLAASGNLPVISYKCLNYTSTSTKPTNFLNMEPTGAMKSVISLLRYYRWNKFSIIHENTWSAEANRLKEYADANNMTVNHVQTVYSSFDCYEENMSCCVPNYEYNIIRNTKDDTRIYVILGLHDILTGIMSSMEALGLFREGEYMVVFVDMLTYSHNDAMKYLIPPENRRTVTVCPTKDFKKRAQSLLVVVASEPTADYEQFRDKVRLYNARAPFNFPQIAMMKSYVSIYASYLYDSVYLYAKALDERIREETHEVALTYEKLLALADNGASIIAKMISSTPYKSISGTTTRLDELGESEGNFSVVAFKPTKDIDENTNCTYNMIPVAHFLQNSRKFPEYKLNPRLPIDWVGTIKPEDEPACGFRHQKCARNNALRSPRSNFKLLNIVFCLTIFCIHQSVHTYYIGSF